ncbi:MFS transporter, partial [Escherichia coli]
IEGMDIQAAGIAVKGVAAEFGLDKTYQGYFLSAGILGLLPGSLMGGRWADKYGRKAVLIASVAIFALFTLFT